MTQVEQSVDLKIKDVVEKLQKLDCTLLGNKDSAWILELLFSPGFHRYHLIEWILSKLGCDIGKMSGPQNSAEERLKNLQSTVSDLGICRENSHEIIKGTAAMKEQLEFWCTLVDIIWLKHEITMNASTTESDEGVALSPEKKKSNKYIDEEYECAVSAINSICENINIKNLFEHEIHLLAPDVEREIRNLSPPKPEMPIPTLEHIKNLKGPTSDLLEQYRSLLFLSNLSVDEIEDDVISSAELNQLEEELEDISIGLQKSAQQDFNSTYNNLKPLILQVESDESPDVGEHFEKLESNLEMFSQLAKSFPQLESSNLKLSEIVPKLEDLLNKEELTDPKYLDAFKLLSDENC